ncbi:Helicase superfamily 1/2, ATP-binding domain [Fusarium oxysporum f. sp. vasinfectum]|nr:Helicase superfamily 1/2, ATP-binding domain [Fusarium oxysporum f. sp. vasinfectum]
MKRPFESTQTDYAVATGTSETTPWLQHTRWAELFRNRSLEIIAATAKLPASQWSRRYLLGQWQGLDFWSSAETEAQLQVILRGLDLMFDRARATLDRTPYISRCWLNTYAKDAFWPHGFRVIPTFKRYLAIWKRFICFVFRVLQYPSWQRKEVYNLRLGSDEIKMMQHILYLVGQLQLGEDGDISDKSDSEGDEPYSQDWHDDGEIPSDPESSDTDQDFNTSTDEDEEIGIDQMSDSEGSDFSLPNGNWLRVSEALFQLSMMFWTYQDPAGNMSSSTIIHFTAVMGIRQQSLAFHSAHNCTSELAGLIWIGRLLFLEYALPVYSYSTLVYEWPRRDHYPSQPDRLDAIRKKYLIRGCYTPFGEIIELKAFAKSIVKREGIPGNLSWDPEGKSFMIGHDVKFKLSEFCATHCKVMKLVGERIDEMMLGLEVDIKTDEIQDDLTCRKAGWSFIQDPKNKLADTWEQLADILRSSSFRGKPFIKGTDWQVDTCIAYLNAGIDLSKLTFAASHLSGGLPGRGTEIATVRYVNTTPAIRNVFFRGGQMIIIISYNKARASNNYAFYIVRYLPKQLSQSLLRYLAIIRPVLGYIAKQLKLPHWSGSEFFFPDPHGKSRHLTSTQASSILRSLTQDLATPWTLSSYRQAALAIAKRYINLRRILAAAEGMLRDAYRLCSDKSPERKMTQQRAKRLSNFRGEDSKLSSIKADKFRSFKNESSLTSYFRIQKQLLAYYYRTVFRADGHFTRERDDQIVPRDTIEATSMQQQAMKNIISILRRQDKMGNGVVDGDCELKHAIRKFCISLICQTVGSRPFRSAILSFCAMKSRKKSWTRQSDKEQRRLCTWHKPGNFNSNLSALTWTAQLILFDFICFQKQDDEDRIPDLLDQMCKKYFQQMTETPYGHILQWRLYLFVASSTELATHQARWSLDGETVDYMGKQLRMEQVSQLALSEFRQAHSLLYDELLFGMEDVAPIEAWRLNDDLDLEDYGASWMTDSPRRRSVLIWEKLVMIHVRYHKSQERTGAEKDNIRFLPPAVGDLLLTYLAFVPPLRQVFLRQSKPGALLSPYLWSKLGGEVWRDVPQFQVAWWRQVAASITKEKFSPKEQANFHLHEIATLDEVEDETELADLAGMSNHSFRTFNFAYAGSTTLTVTNSLHRAYRASQSWRSLFRIDSVLQGKRPRTVSEAQAQGSLLSACKKTQFRTRPVAREDGITSVARRLYNDPDLQLRRPGQRDALLATVGLHAPEQVVVVLATGSGKTLIFMVGAALEGSATTILILPTVALSGNMLGRLDKVALKHHIWHPGSRRSAPIVIVSAEAACTESFLEYANQLCSRQQLDRIVVDECHLTITAGSYRRSMSQLAWHVRQIRTQTIWLTATLPPVYQELFIEHNKLVRPHVIRESTNRPNIRYIVRRECGPGSLCERAVRLVQSCLTRTDLFFERGRDKVIIYCPTKELVAETCRNAELPVLHGRFRYGGGEAGDPGAVAGGYRLARHCGDISARPRFRSSIHQMCYTHRCPGAPHRLLAGVG